ncbi:hypothetical protein [Halarcobacter ebronensis]|uniref:Prepilin-type cleavage/methylation domain-containing protein n=1 Tax=Halarcobacter ebronensis TaxID=1462615 RepID=A0A4Q1AXB0_9BACT|nr:hypothetical protein [Halarcobacter ebronensis]QKF81661.1 hypothetical protein AEBR_1166 [Halarcobacter ebronensis]RXK05585.1 hypothetical protein CRV07_08740 [Halarcobacter ebronensis]
MKKTFSLLETILVIVIISILIAYFIPKAKKSLNFANSSQIKSELALIRNGILKKITKNRLLGEDITFNLDEESVQAQNSKLFSNILDFPLLSTNLSKKEIGRWIKISKNRYRIYFSQEGFLDYSYRNGVFKCLSDKELCEKYE